VDAIPGRGTITLRTRGAGERVRLEVTDTGIGMTEDARRRCLEPFFSTKGAQGTGLGLAVVHGIVQRHHGEIVVASVPGEGTTVTVHLPVVVPHASRLAGADGPAPAVASLHVLHVDDEPGVGEVVAAYLRADGHTVETTTAGRDALDRLRTQHFDVVITDSAMPGISGRQLAVLSKALAPATPVILLTGFGDLMDATGELPPGVDRIVGKPLARTALRTALGVVVPERSTP
jgi:CheY-like chemotaxis protein